jgi:hypothetical protein
MLKEPTIAGEALVLGSAAFDPKVCRVDEKRVSCEKVQGARTFEAPAGFSSPLALADATGDTLFAVVRRTVDKGGDVLVKADPMHVIVAASDGSIFAAAGRDHDLSFVRHEPTMTAERYTLTRYSNGYSGDDKTPWKIDLPAESRMLWAYPYLVWSGPPKDSPKDKPTQLWVMRAAADDKPLEAPKAIGAIEGSFDGTHGCRTTAGLAIAFGTDRLHVLFERNGAWSKVDGAAFPAAPGLEGAFRRRIRYDCVGNDVVVSVVMRAPGPSTEPWRYEMRQSTCGTSGCQEWAAAGREELPDVVPPGPGVQDFRDPSPILGRIGDVRVLLWDTRDGIRMRVGDVEHGRGALLFPPAVQSARLFVRPSGAFVLADGADDVVVGLRLDARGQPQRLQAPAKLQ